VKSVLKLETLSFEVLLAKVRREINHRIQNGECTERALARILGISQPHVHNVLKGIRRLQPQFADRFMEKFGISLIDLLQDSEILAVLETRSSHLDRSSGESLLPRKPAVRQVPERSGHEKIG
jgi:transcriptional regulator with XRE-family HTH domain